MGWRTWRVAMADALYGPDGFYRRPEGGPGAHYRTSSTASPHFARALLRLAAQVDESLDRPVTFDLVEIAAGSGALLTALAAFAADEVPDLAPRLRLTGVELRERPAHLPDPIGWTADVPELTGLLVANEWLDNEPLDVVQLTDAGARLVEVDDAGSERLAGPPRPRDVAWLDRWWPLAEPGDRAEVGWPRDDAWAAALARLEVGVAVAVDYSHVRAERAEGAYAGGTLVGYRDGRNVLPVPDGTCDITAHVALDAVAHAAASTGGGTGVTGSRLCSQRSVLRALGAVAGRPPRELATADPRAYLAALGERSAVGEITARGGLGDFGWLTQSIGVPLPPAVASAADY